MKLSERLAKASQSIKSGGVSLKTVYTLPALPFMLVGFLVRSVYLWTVLAFVGGWQMAAEAVAEPPPVDGKPQGNGK